MLKPHTLDFTRSREKTPASLVLYGLNSSGKTSFVDGIEWFLSSTNEIEWLRREDAKERAYPHQEAKDDESYVEIDFSDSERRINTPKKTFNHKKVTQPTLSSEDEFEIIYDSFVIRPFLRYLEVIDFVYNRTGLEKYQKLASWMGFENELAFQEKIALEIVPELKRKEKDLSDNATFLEKQLSNLVGGQNADELNILSFCNTILKTHKIKQVNKLDDLWTAIKNISQSKPSTEKAVAVSKLTEIEVALTATDFDDVFVDVIKRLQESISKLSKEHKLLEKIDVIALYTQAWDILNKTKDLETNCPVCGTKWGKNELLGHIKSEMDLLKSVKDKRDEINRDTSNARNLLRREQEVVRQIIGKYEEAKKLIPSLDYKKITGYQSALSVLETSLAENVLVKGVKFLMGSKDIEAINLEKTKAIELVKAERVKIEPSKDELKLVEDLEKLNQIKTKWGEIISVKNKLQFFEKEVEKVIALCNSLIKLVQDNTKNRFSEMSERIGRYFSILRSDKDIKQIEILLNEAKGKAAGRSAEIQLNYYDIAVKPAYKVLSESLLNSLGLAVYFTCVKQFNDQCKFIVLDDIMNSLDIENRDTVLDLIEQEFADYQIILFTHDLYWFQRIIKRFPSWISKKIKGWDYKTGSNIDFAKTTKQEIEDLLADSTTVEDAGFKLGKHVEGILNELCENVEAEIKHRYMRNDPPSMEELFDALYKRLKDKLKENPVVEKVQNAKKYEPSIRNFTGHPRGNYSSTISPAEVRRAMEEWFTLEEDLWCSDCRRYVEYVQKRDSIECRCGKLKLNKVSTDPSRKSGLKAKMS